MAKKKRKNRRSRLAKGESLRGKQKSIKARPQKSEEPTVVDVRLDLRKTAFLTAICLGILLLLYLTQSRWITIIPGR